MAEFTEIVKIRNKIHKKYSNNCKRCPLSLNNNRMGEYCTDLLFEHLEEYEQICLDWAKENPEITNADKFFEVFGYNTLKNCIVKNSDCPMCKSGGQQKCNECKYQDFWDKPYVEPKGGTE